MKRAWILVTMVLFLCALSASVAGAEEELCGIVVGQTVLTPGQKMVFVFSQFAAPDIIHASRGKSDKKDDFVQMAYTEPGLVFYITNDDNVIKAIIVKNSGTKLKGIPFEVGDSYDKVKKTWGEPDKKEAGFANYFKKGVIFKVTDQGAVESITIYKPGKVDYDEMNKQKG
ncbi:MAG: hypothetical protein RDV48_06370 [Candidatus Eremiobacteraeota bacterium]|nr:hypothetical protein [Candidatus Eremiobacteraeota bacterium]